MGHRRFPTYLRARAARAFGVAAAAAALASACATTAEPTLGERLADGRYSIDGQSLPACREVVLDCGPLESFRYRTGAGDVAITGGGANAPTRLKLTIFEVHSGDAVVTFEAGTISVRSRSGNPIGLTHLRGSINSRCALALSSRTGRVSVSAFDAPADLDVESGNGAVSIDGVKAEAIRIRCDGGTVRLANATAGRATIDAGSGAVEVNQCSIGELAARSASGALTLTGGEFGGVVLETPEGDVIFDHTRVVSAKATTISGNVVARDAIFVESPAFRSARGEVKR